MRVPAAVRHQYRQYSIGSITVASCLENRDISTVKAGIESENIQLGRVIYHENDVRLDTVPCRVLPQDVTDLLDEHSHTRAATFGIAGDTKIERVPSRIERFCL